MTTIAIKYKELVATSYTIFYMLIKDILYLLEAYFICYLAILVYADCLVA